MAEAKSLDIGEAGCMKRSDKRESENIFEQKTTRSKLLLRGLTRYIIFTPPQRVQAKD
jgi:hypothetical protein